MKIKDLAEKEIAIWGAARESKAILRQIRKYTKNTIHIFSDSNISEDLGVFKPLEFIIGDQIKNRIKDFDFIIKSPGISLYREELKNLKNILSSTNLWLEENANKKIIAITGTKGKSTTSTLCNIILQAEGINSLLGGNIGLPVWDLASNADVYVLELSSYQIADLNQKVDLAAILNLYPTHQLWHGSTEKYYEDKLKLASYTEKLWFNSNDEILEKKLSNSIPTDFFYENGIIYKHNEEFLQTSSLNIAGEHNYHNLAIALTLANQFVTVGDKCKEALSKFSGIPHRLENFAKHQGITYVNDSVATVPVSTLAALKAFDKQDLSIIIGGQDIDTDWSDVYKYLKTKDDIKIIGIPSSGEKLIAEIQKHSKCQTFLAKDLEDAIAIAKKITSTNGIVVLSPGAPSYDYFDSFEERGNLFKSLCLS